GDVRPNDVHVIVKMPGLNAGCVGIDPGRVAHRTAAANRGGAARAGADRAFDLGAADVDRVDDRVVGNDVAVGLGLGLVVHPKRTTDRKSTRLNSSHVSISYAVF